MNKRAKTQKLRTFEKRRAATNNFRLFCVVSVLAQRIASDPDKLAAFAKLITPTEDVPNEQV